MVKSILRLMWKRKKNSFLMITEIFISMLLLFALSAMIINNIKLYNEPLGFEYENVWVVDIDFAGTQDNGESVNQMELLKSNIKSIGDISHISNCSFNVPYTRGMMSSMFKYKDKSVQANILKTDNWFQQVFNLQVSEGRWYSEMDIGQNEIPIVINGTLRNILFKGENEIVGKIIKEQNRKYKIVGIVDTYKLKGELSKAEPVLFQMQQQNKVRERLTIKAKPSSILTFEEQLTSIATLTTKDWNIKLSKLTEHRKKVFNENWLPIIIFCSICAFLTMNIILGLFGTLLYNINNRKPEIGLRRSVGASTIKIYQQFIGEMLMITTMGIIPGIIVAIQFPILKVFEIELVVFLLAILSAIFIIYFLVLISSFIPSKYAATIQPATALHEE